jgi:alpha/beta superfamily hydrolase
MSEERVLIGASGLKIEALVDRSEGPEAVVVTHPHPIYGGDMYNNVVESIVRTYRQMGYSTLRFNFRGVGGSEGQYGQGIGEQEDVNAALKFFSEAGKKRIDLAGYSFGAWVNAMGQGHLYQVDRMVMVSPPVNFIDFSFLDSCPEIKLVIAGSEDDIASPSLIKKMLPGWNPDAVFKVIQGADHFYWGKLSELETEIRDFLDLAGKA